MLPRMQVVLWRERGKIEELGSEAHGELAEMGA